MRIFCRKPGDPVKKKTPDPFSFPPSGREVLHLELELKQSYSVSCFLISTFFNSERLLM